MENFIQFFDNLKQTKFIQSIIVILISFIIYKIIGKFFKKGEKNTTINKKLNNKSKTYLKLLHSILRYIFIVITILIVLQINGVDVSSMLAGVGIAGVIVGLAVQDALKDIIRGFSILSDNYFTVGDIVTYNNVTGKVLVIGLKSTRIKDIATNNIISIANRNIEQIEVVSDSLFVNFPMSYEVSLDRSEEVINKILDKIKTIDDVSDAKYLGVSELADSSIKHLLMINCPPERKLQIRRDTYSCILRTLEENSIEVPYNQIDVHQK